MERHGLFGRWKLSPVEGAPVKILLVLSDGEPVSKTQIERARQGIAARFPAAEATDLAASRSMLSHYQDRLPAQPLIRLEDKRACAGYDIVVYLESKKELVPFRYSGVKGQRVYKVDYLGKLCSCQKLDDRDYPYYRSHAFNWAGPRLDDNFYYFPYGYLFRMTGMGPTNEFGHRIVADMDKLAQRPRTHKLVALFGGSAAWSIFSYHREMFSQRLEDKLNQHMAATAGTLSFTVLNFAAPGNVVLNQMQTYLLFCQKLRPDIVISHDGGNDLAYGKSSSPMLLNKHAITYQYNLEAWSHLLHDTYEFPLSWERDKIPSVNFPRSVIRSYIFRKGQFRDIVQAFGGIFVAGLQPMFFSKRALSPDEKKSMVLYKNNEGPLRNMHLLYDKLEEVLEKKKPQEYEHFVNFHKLFSGYGAATTLMGDQIHTLPAGDEVIAGHYFDHIRDRILGRWDRAYSGE